MDDAFKFNSNEVYARHVAAAIEDNSSDLEYYEDEDVYGQVIEACRNDKDDPDQCAQWLIWIYEDGSSVDDDEVKLRWAILNETNDLDRAVNMRDDEYAGSYGSTADFAEETAIEGGYEVPDWISPYVDWERLGSDWEMDYIVIESGGKRHYFRA